MASTGVSACPFDFRALSTTFAPRFHSRGPSSVFDGTHVPSIFSPCYCARAAADLFFFLLFARTDASTLRQGSSCIEVLSQPARKQACARAWVNSQVVEVSDSSIPEPPNLTPFCDYPF